MISTLQAPPVEFSQDEFSQDEEAQKRRSRKTSRNTDRVDHLLATRIEFIPNQAFRGEHADHEILGDAGPEQVEASCDFPADMPAHLARMCETELLTAEHERQLFRRMNYLKFKAHELRATMGSSADAAELDQLEALLSEANGVRDQIVRANIRLVISVVKKFVTPRNSFDEMLSDGIMTLMNAVDKFDYDRGFRFSTYAYRSIARSTYRLINTRQKEQLRFASATDELLAVESSDDSAIVDEKNWDSISGSLARMMRRLDRREQFIIRGRYALGAHRKTRTFQFLANKLGVSKERARQLEQRAVGKLRAMAAELKLEELFPA